MNIRKSSQKSETRVEEECRPKLFGEDANKQKSDGKEKGVVEDVDDIEDLVDAISRLVIE